MAKKLGVVIICLSILCCFFVQGYTPLFEEYGETTLYVGSASSNAKIIKASEIAFKHKIKGESCFIEKKVDVDTILSDFNAKIVFIEEINGTTNYYCYSKDIKYKAKVKNEIVNLHVSTNGEFMNVGSPIIFGSF